MVSSKEESLFLSRKGKNAMPAYAPPMNVFVAHGSFAEKTKRRHAGLPGGPLSEPEVIASGLHPQPAHDLHFHGGKTIGNLNFTNFYVGGSSSWNPNDIESIDTALAVAMSDQDLNNVMMQYFHNQPISSTFLPSHVLPEPAPSIVSQGDVENLV